MTDWNGLQNSPSGHASDERDGTRRQTEPARRVGRPGLLLLAALALWGSRPNISMAVHAEEALPRSDSGRDEPREHRATQPVGFEYHPIGPPPSFRPTITNVQIVDFDKDGKQDVIACDAQSNSVCLYRRMSDGIWSEQVLADGLIAPAHATVVDLDRDGDNDVLVSLMGNLLPDDNVIGSLVLLENQGGAFEKKVIKDDLRRVVDAQPGDFDGDGDLDLAVAVFGHVRGQVLWLENLGDGTFLDHELLWAAGSIHVPVADYDGDGDPDIAAVVSQDDEEVWGFENLGDGAFAARRLWMTINFDIGSAGLVKSDLDGDGDTDLLLPVGDNLEDSHAVPQPYHGCLWLENTGNWAFEAHRIATFPGTYAAAVGDLDDDGDQDVVLSSMVNDWSSGAPSLVWLENDGTQRFVQRAVARDPIKLVTVACGDLDGDGRPDIAAGGLRLNPPFDRVGRIGSWLTRSSVEADTATGFRDTAATATPAQTPAPPLPDLQWVDSLTRSDLIALRNKVSAAVLSGKDGADDWTELGQAYYAFGFFVEAIMCFEQAVAHEPESAPAHFALGVGLQRAGRVPDAIGEFQGAIAVSSPERAPLIWHELGRCYLRTEDAERAEHAFKQAGSFTASLFQLATLRIKLGRAEEALSALNALTRLEPRAIEPHVLKARAAAALGLDAAARQFRDRAEYNSRNLPMEPVLGAMIEQGNKYGSLELDAQAKALIADENWDAAATLLRKELEATDRIEPALMLAGVEVERGNPGAAIDILERLRVERGTDARSMLILGDAYLSAGEPGKAMALWEDLTGFQPAKVPLHAKLADYGRAIGDMTAARKQQALEAEATGIQNLRLGNPREAIPSFESALSLDSTLPRTWFYLGECLRILGQVEGARIAYMTALQHDPGHGRAHTMLERLPTSPEAVPDHDDPATGPDG